MQPPTTTPRQQAREPPQNSPKPTPHAKEWQENVICYFFPKNAPPQLKKS